LKYTLDMIRRGGEVGLGVLSGEEPHLDRTMLAGAKGIVPVCANYDPDTQSHSQPAQGPRDAFGRCDAPSRTCRLVNATKQEAMALVGIGERTEDGGLSDRLSSTVSAVTHSSGAMILSGNTASLSSLVSSAGTAIGTALSTPAVLAGAAASVVVIGGAVYLCSDAD
ncbi:MAG: hypothetical protein NWQ32_06970, partial [Paracoccaceae bacterium]|nr:hypothetical protein [Paracoccaceae bacterium]